MKFKKPEVYILVTVLVVLGGRYAIPVLHKAFKEPQPIKCSSLIVPGGNGVAKELCLNDDLTAPNECHVQAVKSQDCGMLIYWENENRKNGFIKN